MAWIKLETHVFDKIEIFQMAQELGIDPDAVVGKCCRIWAWFDANTTDGITKSVTSALLDRYCGVNGFCAAMATVGWMICDGDDLYLPNYDRHNSQTAKDRALNAKRVAKSKKKALDNAESNGIGNGEPLPKSLDREYKRRLDKKREKLNTPDGVSIDLWNDFLIYRKRLKAPVTERVVARLIKEAALAQMPLDQVLETIIFKGWRSFEASWVQQAQQKTKELPLGTDKQIEEAYRVECGGDPRQSRFGSYFEMKKFILDFRDKKAAK